MGTHTALHSQPTHTHTHVHDTHADTAGCTLSTVLSRSNPVVPLEQAFIAEVPSPSATATGTGPDTDTDTATATHGWQPVGFALTYFAYSTWKGVCLYLEDIYVEPEWRGRGLGMALIRQCVELAHGRRCQRVMWQALDWNTPAIDFYVGLGAVTMKEWVSLRLTSAAIDAFRQRYAADSTQPNGHTSTSDHTGGNGSNSSGHSSASQGEADDNGGVQQQQQHVSEADMSTLS